MNSKFKPSVNAMRPAGQFKLFVELELTLHPRTPGCDCRIVAVGKRRDGGTRYWCFEHKADATAKYGRPADRCRAAHLVPISEAETISLNIDEYDGGVALWGAVPPIYDTTKLPLDKGVHVHARKNLGGMKLIDETYRAVKLKGHKLPTAGLSISEVDAIYYMVSTIFGLPVKHIVCPLCGYSHLDKDWFSVHPHRRHLCAGCGRNFRDTGPGIGNPVREVQELCGIINRPPRKAKKKLSIRQRDFPGGIRIWGSNPAIIWSSPKHETEGVHVHAFKRDGDKAEEDDTFSEVRIDGVTLDPVMVRTLMAQNALPHIEGRVVPLECAGCGRPQFHFGADAFTPATDRKCAECGTGLQGPGRLRKTIGNPLVRILGLLAESAPCPRQTHVLGLLPETL